MRTVLERELLFMTGKGGVGRTTVAAATGILAASRGLRTVVVEVGEQSRLPHMFGLPPGEDGAPVRLERNLSAITVDPDRALLEWLQTVGGRVSGRLLASSSTFQYFAAAAPGARELVSMVKVCQLTRGGRGRSGRFDLVIVDAPATGHALGMLRSPATFGAIARVGPIAGQTQKVREMLRDPERVCFVAVAQPSDMAVTEAVEIDRALAADLGRGLAGVIVNGLLPRRFSAAEVERMAAVGPRVRGGPAGPAVEGAVHAAQAVASGARAQRAQVARLRRGGLETVTVPFSWGREFGLEQVRAIADHLGRRM